MSNEVLCEFEDGIATLTLNRPQQLNALNYAMVDSIVDHLDRIERVTDIRVVLVMGAGERAFSAGADIREFSESVREGPETAVRDFVRRGQNMTARIEAFAKPVVALVNGLAYGGGCEIVEATHIVLASERASFAKPEIALGMPPTFGGTQRLPRLAGRKRALEHLLTGEPFGVERAREIGLVNAVVSHESLHAAGRALASRIMRHAPEAVASILRATTRGLNMSIGEGLQVEAEQYGRVASTPNLREGLDAWLERRSPSYAGR